MLLVFPRETAVGSREGLQIFQNICVPVRLRRQSSRNERSARRRSRNRLQHRAAIHSASFCAAAFALRGGAFLIGHVAESVRAVFKYSSTFFTTSGCSAATSFVSAKSFFRS